MVGKWKCSEDTTAVFMTAVWQLKHFSVHAAFARPIQSVRLSVREKSEHRENVERRAYGSCGELIGSHHRAT